MSIERKEIRVELVDLNGDLTGETMEKTLAHLGGGVPHRAVSGVVLRRRMVSGREIVETLLQRRSMTKLIGAGLQSNFVCTHTLPGEPTVRAIERRGLEEMGVCGLDLREVLTFLYHVEFPGGYAEWEHDTLYVAWCEGDLEVMPALSEVTEWRWVEVEALLGDMAVNPHLYTWWGRMIYMKALGGGVLYERSGG